VASYQPIQVSWWEYRNKTRSIFHSITAETFPIWSRSDQKSYFACPNFRILSSKPWWMDCKQHKHRGLGWQTWSCDRSRRIWPLRLKIRWPFHDYRVNWRYLGFLLHFLWLADSILVPGDVPKKDRPLLGEKQKVGKSRDGKRRIWPLRRVEIDRELVWDVQRVQKFDQTSSRNVEWDYWVEISKLRA